MKITIIATGSRGDVQPCVALGAGLSDAGHTISFMTFQEFQDMVAGHGLEFVNLGGGVEAIARDLQVERGGFLRIMAKQGRAAQQLTRQAAASGLITCPGSDFILAGLGGLFIALALSEKLNIPVIQAHYIPFTPTREFASFFAPSRLPAWANDPSHRLTQQMIWQMSRAADNTMRSQVLQLPKAPFTGPFASLQQQTRATLYGYSPHVLPQAGDWGDSVHVTGYWFLDSADGWEPPAELVRFLESGPPPVYVGFGSMPSMNPGQTADLVLQALARAGRRGVLFEGWGGLKKEHLPDTICMIGSTPHSWLFPRMAAVVHHGGAGTTAAGLGAGVPSIVTPFFADQPFWGRQVYALGVGPQPIPRQRLTAERLGDAIRVAVSDVTMRERAAELGKRIRAEDGVARAVEVIAQLGKRPHSA